MPSGAVLAIKEITVSDETRRLQIFKEISTLLGSGDAPNLVHYHGARSYDGAIQIAMEYMDGGSLGDLLQAIGPISEEGIAASNPNPNPNSNPNPYPNPNPNPSPNPNPNPNPKSR